MKKVMVRAWEIAREGQGKFGGKVSEYISKALKIAWAEVKEETLYVTELPINNKNLWIAKIEGTHPRFKLDRKFLNDYELSYNGYYKVFYLRDGIYAAKFSNRASQAFFKVVNGEAYDITYAEAIEIAREMERKATKVA